MVWTSRAFVVCGAMQSVWRREARRSESDVLLHMVWVRFGTLQLPALVRSSIPLHAVPKTQVSKTGLNKFKLHDEPREVDGNSRVKKLGLWSMSHRIRFEASWFVKFLGVAMNKPTCDACGSSLSCSTCPLTDRPYPLWQRQFRLSRFDSDDSKSCSVLARSAGVHHSWTWPRFGRLAFHLFIIIKEGKA